MSVSDISEIGIGLAGLGNVGSGLVQMLHDNGRNIEARSGLRLSLVHVASRTLRTKAPLGSAKKSTDWKALVEDPAVDVVVELIGGTGVAVELILAALKAGKPVVTANKAALTTHGDRIFAAAVQSQTEIYFEGAVGGGIPVVKVLRETLLGDRIREFRAIINGTTNYMLTRMNEGKEYASALKQAQELGFAEADPTLDVDGSDAAQKTALLAMLAWGAPVDWKKIPREGITRIQPTDMIESAKLGYALKLLGIGKRHDGKGKDSGALELRVHPTLVPSHSELGSVENEFNAVHLKSEFQGPSLLYGRGAGGRPTACAVMSDLTDLADRIRAKSAFHAARYEFKAGAKILPIDAVESKYYLRVNVAERPGVLAKITAELARQKISVQSLVQRDATSEKSVPIVFVLHRTGEKALAKALARIAKMSFVKGAPIFYRIEEEA